MKDLRDTKFYTNKEYYGIQGIMFGKGKYGFVYIYIN